MYVYPFQRVGPSSVLNDGKHGTEHIDDTAALVLRFRDGMLGTVCCGRFAPDSRNDAVVYGSHGRILLANTIWEHGGGTLEVRSESENLSESFEPDLLAGYQRQIEAFSRAVQEDGEVNASGMDGLRIVQATSAAVESIRTGRTVAVEPV